MNHPQTSATVLLIRPRHFSVNTQTAASNVLQQDFSADPDLAAAALREVDTVAARLDQAGVEVLVFDDTDRPRKPDAAFVNNWLSSHADGRVVLYPMHAPNRRPERRPDLIEALQSRGFQVTKTVDLSILEGQGMALEGTGSLVMDRLRQLAFAALSQRTHPRAVMEFERRMNFRVATFQTRHCGRPVYHTNVMLALGRHFAVVCDQVIPDPLERDNLLTALADSDRELIHLDPAQMEAFAGNLLELAAPGGPLIALSARALGALRASQRRCLEAHGQLLAPPLPAIETGGGSLRCMLAEIFLPRTVNGPG